MKKILFKGGSVVAAKGIRRADVLVSGDKIISVGRIIGVDAQSVDVSGKLIFPGFIDAHTHLGIIEDTCALRDQYCPDAKVSVLSNSTQLGRPDVVKALKRCDNRILKLDAGTDEMMRRIDLPVNKELTVERIMGWLAQFEGDFTLQTCFLRGEHDGKPIDNTTPEELAAWYKAVERLRPKQIMIYVIDRKTPEERLEKISREEMERIAAPLIAKGFEVSISA